MLISTTNSLTEICPIVRFQSLDWVDVDFDTGTHMGYYNGSSWRFQSLDWVDVDFDARQWRMVPLTCGQFQSLDWVDVDFDGCGTVLVPRRGDRFNPSTGLMLISTVFTCDYFLWK